MKYLYYFFLLYFCLFLTYCTVRLPAITFTQSGTAAEKQMIGTDKEIEKDGWILSSVKTSALGSEIWKREYLTNDVYLPEKDEEVLLHLKRMAYFAPEIKLYKTKGYIGEALDGKLKINPLLKTTKYARDFEDVKSRVEEFLKLTNESRAFLFAKKVQRIEKELKDDQKSKTEKKKVQFTYYNLVEDGEYYEISSNKWIKKE
jgi:hypothetical protein